MPERYVGFRGWLLLLVVACTSARHPAPAADSATLSVVKARGNEPSWSVEVSQAAGVIYRTPEASAGIVLPYAEPEKTPTGHAWYAKGSGHTLDLLVNEVPCIDSMTGEKFARSAVVIVDGARHEGCAGAPLNHPS